MVSQSSSSDISTPNFSREPISDEDAIRGFILALGAGGRKQKTVTIYEDSLRMLSNFARDLGLPGLTTMDRTHIRHRQAGRSRPAEHTAFGGLCQGWAEWGWGSCVQFVAREPKVSGGRKEVISPTLRSSMSMERVHEIPV